MTPGERGFLLLGSHLGDPDRKCLSSAQFRELARRVQAADLQKNMRQIQPRDLIALGYSREMAFQIISLLEQEDLLDAALRRAHKLGFGVLTRISEHYPQILRTKLGTEAPVCLWYQGDLSILDSIRISLVGNRSLRFPNASFAQEAGFQAARQGFTLVSGNARGADRTAQNACLQAGGRIISVVADELSTHSAKDRILYLCEDSFDLPFSPLRALSRNRIIHAISPAVLVAQCDERRGGTWDGSQRNLRQGWSNVFCFQEESKGIGALIEMGGEAVDSSALTDLSSLCENRPNLFAY